MRIFIQLVTEDSIMEHAASTPFKMVCIHLVCNAKHQSNTSKVVMATAVLHTSVLNLEHTI